MWTLPLYPLHGSLSSHVFGTSRRPKCHRPHYGMNHIRTPWIIMGMIATTVPICCVYVYAHTYFVNKNEKYLQKGADKILQCKKHFLVYRFKMSGNLQRIHHKLTKAKRAEFENTQICFMQT